MKKQILKRLGSFILVCFMVFLNIFVLLVPASAEGNEQSDPAYIISQYENLVVEDKDLFDGMHEWIAGFSSQNQGIFELQDLVFNDLLVISIAYRYGEFGFRLQLDPDRYYVLKNNQGSTDIAYLRNSQGEELGQVLFQDEGDDGYGYVFHCDSEYRYLNVSGISGLSCSLYEVDALDTVYDVSKTSFAVDMEKLFNGSIDLSKFNTQRVPNDQRTSPYIDFVAFYSDANWGDWSSPSYQSGNDYFYIYNNYNEVPIGGTIRIAGVDYDLTLVSGIRCFSKFKLSPPNRQFITDQINLSRFPVDSITLDFLLGGSRTYPFQNFYIAMEYTNRTDWKIQKVSFSGEQKLKLDIGYTYWRQADYSSKGEGWHNQVDSIYFGIPNAIVNNQRLVDVKLEYQKATTKPIVVTKTSENINGTYVSKWFEDTAKNPFNELSSDSGWVRYQRGKPYFRANKQTVSSVIIQDYAFNVRNGMTTYDNLKSVYWAFDVEDPTIVDKVPDNGVNSLTSAALSNPCSSVSRDRLEQWMINYTLDGASETYEAADPTDPEHERTVQVNGILFEQVEPKSTHLASQVQGADLTTFGDNNNFWTNLSVGWKYAFNYLIGFSSNAEPQLKGYIYQISDPNSFEAEGSANYYKFAVQDTTALKDACGKSITNDETFYLVHFDTSDYYSMSFNEAKYKEGNVDSGTEKSFDGYVAVMDMYLDLHVLELYFKNAVGEVIPVAVTSNHINGIADVTHSPESGELDDAAGEAIKNWVKSKLASSKDGFLDFLKKALVIIAVVVIVLVVLRLVIWLVGRKQSNNTTVVIRDDAPRRNRRRRR